MTDILDELHWRGLVAQSTDEAALREALAAGPVTYYCGFDPTAPSLHMGNLVQLITMRRFQDAGHRPIALVGGSTGLIGDPKPTAERTLNSPETVAAWVTTLREQVSRFLRPDGPNPVEVVNNLDWTAPLSALDFLRDFGKHFRVNRMLAKEAVSARLESQDGISYTEFSYQILQGMDFLELYRKHGCVLQLGGSDQWGNLTAGVDLIHRVEQVSVHALTTTLITKSDGTKYGKTEGGGTVWLDAEMMSPYAFYQFWLNAEDSQVGRLLRVFTFRGREEIEALERATLERPQAREGQRALAADVTTLVHGERATAQAIAASQALFGRGVLAELDEQTLDDATAELTRVQVKVGTPVVDAFVQAGLAPSRSGARRTISEGGAYVNNTKVEDVDAVLAADQLLHERFVVLRRGRKALAAGVADGA